MSAAGATLLQVAIDGVERTGEVGKCVVASNVRENGSAWQNGLRLLYDYTLNLTVTVDHSPGSLWRAVLDHAGGWAPIIYRPYGNTPASIYLPHYRATALLSLPGGDLMGAQADRNRLRRQRVEMSWTLSGQPIPVTVAA